MKRDEVLKVEVGGFIYKVRINDGKVVRITRPMMVFMRDVDHAVEVQKSVVPDSKVWKEVEAAAWAQKIRG